MAKTNATNVKIYKGGVKIGFLTSVEVNQNHSVRDATSKDSQGNAENLEGLKDWDMSGELWLDPSATVGYDELVADFNARSQVSVRWSTETSGESYHQGNAYITSLGASAGVEENISVSVSFQGTGALAYIQLT